MLVTNLDAALVRSHVEAREPDTEECELAERLTASERRAGSLLRFLGWVGRELQQEGTLLRMPLVAWDAGDKEYARGPAGGCVPRK